MAKRTLLPLLLLALPACPSEIVSNGEGGAGGRGAGGAPVVTGTLTTTSETATTSAGTTSTWTTSTTTTSTGVGGGSTGVVISNPNGITLDSLAAVPGGALMGARHWESAGGNGVYWDVYRLGEDGTLAAPAHTIAAGKIAGSIGPIEVAAVDGYAAATVWHEQGCLLAILDPDGSSTLGLVPIGLGWCQGFVASGSTYSVLGGQLGASYDTSLVRFDQQGALLGVSVLDGFGAYLARADAPGATVFAWSTDGIECSDCPIHVVDRRFSSSGVPLGPINPVFTDPKFGIQSDRTHLAMAPLADGALMAWSAHGGSSSIGRITVQRLDASGAITGPAASPVPAGSELAGLDLVALPSGDVLLVWVEAKQNVRGVVLTPQGTAKGAPFEVGNAPWAQSIKAVRTFTGALAVVGQGGSVTAFPIALP